MGLEEHHLDIKTQFRLKLKAYLSGTRTNYFLLYAIKKKTSLNDLKKVFLQLF